MLDHKEILPIIRRFEENELTYSLGGSGLLYYFNLSNTVNDWDLIVDCPKDMLLKVIDGYDWIEQDSGDYPFASEYRIHIPSLRIDIIGGFAFYAEEEVVRLPTSHIQNRTWDGIKVSRPEIWYVAYYLMGREAKSNLILGHLQTHKEIVDQHVIRDLLMRNGLNYEIKEELSKLIQ
ncbi:hypothetical protein QP794_24740 [Paenibacillus sp. UMB7766-LJ446]|uniref:hypothetical protein n=1 Tax=Paenibacillus sp. UMB7766-LJ446 TaxID=3046313 RepID=UPI00254CC85B|nr:hypothetical protein [Paenibacillus sp. UMB7766-LJ446]MDK8193300.1 hypothetical protein [Paenibacillus sp. UMB7766-LJ446]